MEHERMPDRFCSADCLTFSHRIPQVRGPLQRRPRVEAGVRGEQPAEAVPGRRGSGNGIKRPGKGARRTQNGTENLL